MKTNDEAARVSLSDWVKERLANCHLIAALKVVPDRDAWLEDADYFSRLGDLLEEREREDRLLRAGCALYYLPDLALYQWHLVFRVPTWEVEHPDRATAAKLAEELVGRCTEVVK